MSKKNNQFICNNCGICVSKWSGQCHECNTWGSLEEKLIENKNYEKSGNPQNIELLNDSIADETFRLITDIKELDRVLGGGLVEGSAVVIGGDPGIGKSTLLLQLIARLTEKKIDCLYITGEESINQIKIRANRLGVNDYPIKVLSSTNLEDIITTLDALPNIKLIVIDSIQTVNSNRTNSAFGAISQIKLVSQELIFYSKKRNISLILSCHVTKEGQLAGPKLLEHMVDTVLYFEGDHTNYFRILRSIKNRFGSVNEIGVF